MLINLILNNKNSVIIEIGKSACVLQLNKKLASIINVDYSNIDIYKTKDMEKSIQTISKFLLKNNDIIIYNIIKNNRKNYLGYKLKYSQNNLSWQLLILFCTIDCSLENSHQKFRHFQDR